jgi:CheY-like chemotaxis protein
MKTLPTILIVDDDEGHAILIHQNLAGAGLENPIQHFRDGQEILDFFFDRTGQRLNHAGESYLVLLDIRMPKVDGIEVLRRLKVDPELKRLLVIMLTTADDMRDVERCYTLGCSAYVQKPVDYQLFADAMGYIAQFSQLLLVAENSGR